MFWGSNAWSVLQVPMHPFLLLVCFNVFASPVNPSIFTAIELWATFLTLMGPLFIVMEGLSSLLVAQKAGQEAKKLVERGEVFQFGLLIATSVTYVISAWWIVEVSTWRYFFVLLLKAIHPSHTQPRLLPLCRLRFWALH
jgi:hypothetical protein